MSMQAAGASKEQPGLSELDSVKLGEGHLSMVRTAMKQANGSPTWRNRKEAEATSLMRLSQLAPENRLEVAGLDLAEELRAVLILDVPVPCRDAVGDLRIAERAVLGLYYPEETLRGPRPGHSFLSILKPRNVWHANVASNVPWQPLCLGPTLPSGIPAFELVILAYGALSLQSVMIDELDPAGVLNVEAARWWQQNRDRIPLSKAPFLSAGTGHKQDGSE